MRCSRASLATLQAKNSVAKTGPWKGVDAKDSKHSFRIADALWQNIDIRNKGGWQGGISHDGGILS